MSMSLDGYVADLNHGVAEVFDWYFNSGDVEFPAGWPRPDSTVHFVTDGIESAVNQAKAAAAGKSVGVHGADTIQQLLNAGLLDEIHVDIAAVLLGSGIRLFDHLAGTPAVLGNPAVIPGASLMSPDHAQPGNGLLLFFRVDDFDMALRRARALVPRLEEEPHVNTATQTMELSLRDPDDLFGAPVSLDFRFHVPSAVIEVLRGARLPVIEHVEREPYPEVEYPSRRCYLLARAV